MRIAASSLALALIVGTVACSGADDATDPDEITSEELALGEAAGDAAEEDGVEPTEDIDGDADVSELEEPAVQVDPEYGQTSEALTKCHAATGYKHGHRIKLCVVKRDGKWVEVQAAQAFDKLKTAARARGVSLHIVSGFRTMAQQRSLYALYRSGRGNLAAVPGFSNHQSGHAFDLNTRSAGVYRFLAQHGHALGFRRTVPSEGWHWEHWGMRGVDPPKPPKPKPTSSQTDAGAGDAHDLGSPTMADSGNEIP